MATSSAHFESRITELREWLIDGAQTDGRPGAFMKQTCERLVEAGLPLWRVNVFTRTLHPDVFGRSFVWRAGQDVVMTPLDFDAPDSEEYRLSPMAILHQTQSEVRVRVDDPANWHFPIIKDLQQEGVTDYFAAPLRFADGAIQSSSWSTREPGGFTDDQLDAIRSVLRPLARVIEIIVLRRTAAVLLDTYVGYRAGEHILGGQIRRGHAESMHAAIWLSDLRGFTPLSDRLPPADMVEVLNRYFDCQVQPIIEGGGEILKFMGDGLLAVFPLAEDGTDAAAVRARVVKAARRSRDNVRALTYASRNHNIDSFRFGLALHVGHVLYGNIGGGNRLDFTCIGPAINLAARLEKIAGRLNRTVVASREFMEASADQWNDLGEFVVAGFSQAERVFGLSDEG